MRRGCLSQGQVKCDKCNQLIPYPKRYVVVDEDEKGNEVENGGKTVRYCIDCALAKGYAHNRELKGDMLISFLPDSDVPPSI
jgi:ribosomal protein S26